MKAFPASEIYGEIRQVLGDTTPGAYVISDAKLLINVNAAIRALFRDAPASSYTSPVAFRDSADLTVFEIDTATDIEVDKYWKQALVYFTCARCFYDDNRNTASIERGDALMKKYKDAL